MLYPDFGMLFTAADCLPDPEYDHDFHASSRLWLCLLLQLAFPDILFVCHLSASDHPLSAQSPDDPASSGRKRNIWGIVFFLALDLLAFYFMRPLAMDIPSLFHPSTVEITEPDFDVSSGNEDNYDCLSGKDEYGSSYTFHLPSQQYHACQNACKSKENAVIEVTYLPHSKYLLQSEVKSTSLFLNVIIVQPGTLHR